MTGREAISHMDADCERYLSHLKRKYGEDSGYYRLMVRTIEAFKRTYQPVNVEGEHVHSRT